MATARCSPSLKMSPGLRLCGSSSFSLCKALPLSERLCSDTRSVPTPSALNSRLSASANSLDTTFSANSDAFSEMALVLTADRHSASLAWWPSRVTAVTTASLTWFRRTRASSSTNCF